MAASAEETAALLGRVPVFEALRPEDLVRVADVAVPRSFRGGRGRLPRARRLGHVLRRPLRPRARRARARRRPPDHARDVRPRRHLRRAGDVRRRAALGHRRGGRRRSTCSASSASTCARLLARHPEIAVKLVIALGRRLRAANERLARQSFQTVQSRVAAVLGAARRAGAQPRAPASATCCVTATQAELAQLAGSSRESASRFLAVLERAGVISQGRGRLDGPRPGRARRAMSTEVDERPDAAWRLLRRRRGPRGATCS